MILENSFDMADEAKNVWAAMQGVFADGFQQLIYLSQVLGLI